MTLTIDISKFSTTTDKVDYGKLVGERTHFITITLKPRMFRYTSHTQLDCTRFRLYDLVDSHLKDRAIFVAELTVTGNIHYHGVVAFASDNEKFAFINRLKKITAFGLIHIKPDTVDTHAKMLRVALYMSKDLNTTSLAVSAGNKMQTIVITSQVILNDINPLETSCRYEEGEMEYSRDLDA